MNRKRPQNGNNKINSVEGGREWLQGGNESELQRGALRPPDRAPVRAQTYWHRSAPSALRLSWPPSLWAHLQFPPNPSRSVMESAERGAVVTGNLLSHFIPPSGLLTKIFAEFLYLQGFIMLSCGHRKRQRIGTDSEDFSCDAVLKLLLCFWMMLPAYNDSISCFYQPLGTDCSSFFIYLCVVDRIGLHVRMYRSVCCLLF